MKKKIVSLSNDQVDAHGHKMSVEALIGMKDQTNSKVIVSQCEHDFSMPPIGRMEKAELINHQDVNWLMGEFSLFEFDDIEKENELGDRELAIHYQDIGSVTVAYDRSYELEDLVEDVEDLQRKFDENGKVQFELKKSVEPISTLTILVGVGIFAASGFFNGFLGEAGKDAWAALKSIIQKKKSKSKEEQHYQFIFIFQNEFYKVEVMLIFKNPQPDGVENEIRINQKMIEDKVIEYYEREVRAKRIVFLSDGQGLEHIYSVYRCGTPFDIANINEYKELLESRKNKMKPV